ncbi:acylphosphatase [Breoghania sp. L-A4]|uniref:acylphosphatase n=1 Tax=Breoghania sp. L-A4 TaxID=2304600 RepID=UPI000E35D29A|nr:acylphosphatase [Breoghania sp. L-A4]AXS40843.1 hypothetical protein D1F64_13320 [Breoghania sp. L-A4]
MDSSEERAPDDEVARAVHVLVSGRVQGVGYRAWCARAASAHGLSGWVRNCSSGDVEAVFSGAPDAVEKMLEACKAGPDWARVVELRVLGTRLSSAAPSRCCRPSEGGNAGAVRYVSGYWFRIAVA